MYCIVLHVVFGAYCICNVCYCIGLYLFYCIRMQMDFLHCSKMQWMVLYLLVLFFILIVFVFIVLYCDAFCCIILYSAAFICNGIILQFITLYKILLHSWTVYCTILRTYASTTVLYGSFFLSWRTESTYMSLTCIVRNCGEYLAVTNHASNLPTFYKLDNYLQLLNRCRSEEVAYIRSYNSIRLFTYISLHVFLCMYRRQNAIWPLSLSFT